MGSGPTIGVLALQGDVREHRAMLEACGVASRAVRRPAELDGLDGIVLPGGESTTMYKLARTFDLFEPLRSALRDGLPAFGTCAGMIMLADHIEAGIVGQETFGGLDVVVRRNAFGRQVDSFEEPVEFTPSWAEPFTFPATFIRAPWVEKVGDGVEIVARAATADGGDRIVGVRRGCLLATSFHPEITGDARIHQLFVDLVTAR
ncbi:pyridoxal 5'-phosphate synthase glutaminase subunit PdxT [Nocardioides donggukensis]|uniref:Pyridoxal 5'-phosphate synthase subunit PdxT n=1 Tax=Nocardioides donggukensis TaxID=2774019 RepID=A0A927K688_9ACTN|nr:pyridoxal 5'-phosphate synthase glutaminase subunit PdxT [Nocardioides donggukensis]MBD8869783.1 pyridoxal 5'-phosphate synthase glutaminase subunit PdxT [Nocardioides donggukensis]